MGIWERFRAWYQRCRTCEVDAIDGSLLDQVPELGRVEPLKFGHLYRCAKCARSWFLPEHGQWLHRIHDDHLVLVQHWNRTPLTLDESILGILAGIGGTPDFYRDSVAVPCSVRDAAGEWHDKSIVLVSRQPPVRWYGAQARWADEVAAVSVSTFALPLDVRRASSEKTEESMGFAPVKVVDDAGTEYTLGSATTFFDHKGVRGERIRLAQRQKRWRNVVHPAPAQRFYFVDWFDGCADRLVPPRGA